jgi:HAD domain family 1 in Swiss Army Knife RNA repair proteins
MKFKQAFLEDLMFTYKDAEDIRVYEDRSKQYVSRRL